VPTIQWPYSPSEDFHTITNRDVYEGEELLTFYGDAWYCARGLPLPIEPMPSVFDQYKYLKRQVLTRGYSHHTPSSALLLLLSVMKEDLASLKTIKQASEMALMQPIVDRSVFRTVCMSDVYIKTSSIIEAGRGLFAKRDFMAGELITVSPILILKKSMVDALSAKYHEKTMLPNYCLWNGKSPYVLLPISTVSMMNHSPMGSGSKGDAYNVEIHWFSWAKDDNVTMAKARVWHDWDLLGRSDQLTDHLTAPFDLGYYATRDIEEGEELFLDYGLPWERNWLAANCHGEDRSGCATIQAFRSYIYVQPGLFPD
jgi:hypothetical protein